MKKLTQEEKNQEFIRKAKLVHGDKYDYAQSVYGINNKEKVVIICPIHGDFEQTPNIHLRGHGCPKCNLKTQDKIFKKLKELFPTEEILFEVGKDIVSWLENQRIDIYFPKYNIAIEYNGEQHYIPIKYFGGELQFEIQQYRDELKRKKCSENNCTLFEVKYNYSEEDFNNLIININNVIKNYESPTKNNSK